MQEVLIGDHVWFYNYGHQGKTTCGQVVHKFQLPGYTYEHYVIELKNSIESEFVIRHYETISFYSDRDINLFSF